MAGSLNKLEHLLGYRFQKIALLERAVTHRSWAHENSTSNKLEIRKLHNESLEFVGDSVLGAAVAEYLYKKNPDATEGELTLMKHHLVSTATLARLAEELKLGDFLRVGRGEEKTGGRKKQALLADALEAVIAGVFFDRGYISARNLVHRLLAEEFTRITPGSALDYKTLLQEKLQAAKKSAPKYTVIETEGPPHSRTFYVEANWDGGKMRGQGLSIKAAEMMAAKLALQEMEKL
ncbi:MAG TPA: ribonuclease III [Pyrinomonadaceae bacterium]|jgi:ribonuclease-3|nr:ribonuclease III [Pyrinomonadaceae bacterium]